MQFVLEEHGQLTFHSWEWIVCFFNMFSPNFKRTPLSRKGSCWNLSLNLFNFLTIKTSQTFSSRTVIIVFIVHDDLPTKAWNYLLHEIPSCGEFPRVECLLKRRLHEGLMSVNNSHERLIEQWTNIRKEIFKFYCLSLVDDATVQLSRDSALFTCRQWTIITNSPNPKRSSGIIKVLHNLPDMWRFMHYSRLMTAICRASQAPGRRLKANYAEN